ncbi:hypothetical protein [Cesiribacter andamanensis]|uniref:Uncharacterized protein n=1 Tax=Cesiribacter andamanensis AMV16 TaxID=1279009 RepID=M7N5M1_9BACT|nr:hypothetical protein [Cesiribacter andamanensis]EMR02587.1 hypothetical protein ADICEAN_02293 [Cesiribacter andamanensis AMV16]
MYLNLPHEDLDKKRIDRFILKSMAAALLLGALLLAGALLMPDSLHLQRTPASAVSSGPIQTSLTMINSLGRMQPPSCHPVSKAEEPALASTPSAPVQLLINALKPLAKKASLPMPY